MAGTTAVASLVGRTDELRHRLAETPLPAAGDVEAELQRLARERLDPPIEPDVETRSHRNVRASRPRRRPLVGAFDSPEGFVFGSGGANRKR
jgi:hypothetical protein